MHELSEEDRREQGYPHIGYTMGKAGAYAAERQAAGLPPLLTWLTRFHGKTGPEKQFMCSVIVEATHPWVAVEMAEHFGIQLPYGPHIESAECTLEAGLVPLDFLNRRLDVEEYEFLIGHVERARKQRLEDLD